MNHSTLVNSVVVAIVGVAAMAMSAMGHGMSGTIKHDGAGSASVRGAIVAMAAAAPGAYDTMQASEATPALVTGDSRLDNYRLERDSCCIGND